MLIENRKYCWAWNRVYVKANGRIPCWCDTGEQHTIIHQQFGDVDFINDIVNSKQMCDMRNKILFDNENYITQCSSCCCMIDQGQHHRFADKEFVNTAEKSNNAIDIINRVEKKRKWLKGSIDRIAEIQLEPSFPCNLRCPGCLQGIHENPLSTEPAPYMFPYEWFERMIDSIVMNQVRLNRLVFVGRGEPTLNAKLPDMVSYARTTIPGLTMSMDTNANQPFKNEYLNLNWINCSIDGPDQASYSKYRRNGRFDKTIEFMRSGVRSKNESKSTCKIKWKYILFNTNDTDEHLRLAQELASDIGIDELHFIITHCGSFDNKITPSARFKSINDLRAYIENNVIFDKVICSTAT